MKDYDTFNALKARGVLSNEDEVRFAIAAKDDAMLSQLQQSLPLESAEAKRSLPVGVLYEKKGPSVLRNRGHCPVVFVIEQLGAEGVIPESKVHGVVDVGVKVWAEVFLIQTALKQGESAVIASRGLTCGIISIAKTDDKYSDLRELMTREWDLYNVEGTQFTVWLPKKLASYYEPIFNVGSFTRIPLDTTAEILAHCPPSMTHKEDPRLEMPQYQQSDLDRIFSPSQPEEAILDFLILGHGSPGGDIAGLPVSLDIPENQRITSLLAFLNEKLRAGVVHVASCSSGGQTELLMPRVAVSDFAQKHGSELLRLQRDYNYILIIGSVSTKYAAANRFLVPQKLEEFFDLAAKTGSHEISLDELLRSLVFVAPGKLDVHGYASFPQVLLPGGLRFTAFSGIEKEVLVAGDVFVAVREQEERPIQVRDKRVVLWYPPKISPTVEVQPFKQSQLGPWSGLMPVVNINLEYPEFVPMLVGSRRCTWFKHIVVKSDESSGVLHFLRDTFCDVNLKTARPHDILISVLEGNNDIATQIEAAQSWDSSMGGMGDIGGMQDSGMGSGMSGGMMGSGMGMVQKPQNPFLALTREGAGNPITLHNVMIRINPPANPESMAIYIDYDGSGYWVYRRHKADSRMRSAKAWDFQRALVPPPVAECEQALASYAEKRPQKSLGQIVRQKLELLPERALRKAIHEREMERRSLE